MIGERVTVRLNDQLVFDDVVMENYWQRDLPIDPADRSSCRPRQHAVLPEHLSPGNPAGGGQRRSGRQGRRSVRDHLQWERLQRVDRRRRELRRGRRHDGLPGRQGWNRLHREGVCPTSSRGSSSNCRPEATTDSPSVTTARTPSLGRTRTTGARLGTREVRRSRPATVSRLGVWPRPGHRGYLRPAGEWNFQEVTVPRFSDHGRTERDEDSRC